MPPLMRLFGQQAGENFPNIFDPAVADELDAQARAAKMQEAEVDFAKERMKGEAQTERDVAKEQVKSDSQMKNTAMQAVVQSLAPQGAQSTQAAPEEARPDWFGKQAPDAFGATPQAALGGEAPKGGGKKSLMELLPAILGAVAGGMFLGPVGIPLGLMGAMSSMQRNTNKNREMDITQQHYGRSDMTSLNNLAETQRSNGVDERIARERLDLDKDKFENTKDDPTSRDKLERWHAYNAQLATEGKDPISYEEFGRYEKGTPAPNPRIDKLTDLLLKDLVPDETAPPQGAKQAIQL